MVTNTKEFDKMLFNTGRVFKVLNTDEHLFKVIQEHRPEMAIDLDFNQIKKISKSSLIGNQLYFTTDFNGLYLINEKTLRTTSIYMPMAISSIIFKEKTWEQLVDNDKNSVEQIVKNANNLDELSTELFARIIAFTENSLKQTILEILLERLSNIILDKDDLDYVKSLLIIYTRKELNVFFQEFDNLFTKTLNYKYQDKDKITIYRGENSRSQSYKKTHSWTTNKKIASKFATFFGDGKLIETEITKDKILHFYKDDPEEEVLVNPADIKNVKVTKVVK